MSSQLFENHTSLKSAQLNAIYRMLAFNNDESFTGTSGGGGTGGSGGNTNFFDYNHNNSNNSNSSTNAASSNMNHQWKILIYDTTCRSIISPILSVQQLRRKCNVTLHLLLHSDREPIPDVPAVYFVSPTKENLVRIAQDCYKQLYLRIHLNFVTKLERPLMEEFAQLMIQTSQGNNNVSSVQQIASIHDQYLNYICYEQHLFTLNITNSYVMYNNSKHTEQMIDQYMTDIAYGLFSVIASLGQIPIIRCPKVRKKSIYQCVGIFVIWFRL
jgi:sec1 family domain-containing protein 1